MQLCVKVNGPYYICHIAGEVDDPMTKKTEILKTEPTESPAPAVMRQQATPQHQACAGAANVVKRPDSQETILYKPVTADGVKAFFDGIKKASTYNMDHLEANLPPPGVVLQPAPVAQILPTEIEESQQIDEERNKKEDAILTRLYKMDDVEIVAKVEKSKQHPLFEIYKQEILADLAECTTQWGAECPHEDLCHFDMWLEDQAQAYKDRQQPPQEQATDKTKIELDTTPAFVNVVQAVPCSSRSKAPAQAAVAAPATVPAGTLLDPASPASYVNCVSPGTMMDLETQMADLTINPPATPVAAKPGPAASPKPETVTFKPVTPEAMQAFWSAMQRKSTDDLSMASTPQDPSAAAAAHAPTPPPEASPSVPVMPATQPAPAAVAPPPEASTTVPATQPAPAAVAPPAISLEASPSVPVMPATQPAPAAVAPPPEASTTVPATQPAPAAVAPPAISLEASTSVPVIPATQPAPATMAPSAIPASVPVMPATQPAPATAPSTPATPAQNGNPAASAPVTPTAPASAAAATPVSTPSSAAATPAASEADTDRAEYMRFYRSVRSKKAPAAVTKSLTCIECYEFWKMFILKYI